MRNILQLAGQTGYERARLVGAVSGSRFGFRSGLGVVLALAFGLAGCDSFPRGAGLQSEVLAVAGDPSQPADPNASLPPAEFAVAPVNRTTVARYDSWPALGEAGLPWVERVDQPDSQIISPGDTLAITIWSTEANDLLASPGQRFITLPPMQVSGGGRVFLPYIGDVRVSGMSPQSARAAIEARYIDVTPSAQVQLSLAGGRQSSVSLVGGVAGAGVFPLPDQDMTVLELIAQGGGALPGLNNPQIRLQRGDRLYGTSYGRLLDAPRLNTTLVGGDRVYLETDERYFLSLGAAGSEARHPFPQDRVTALDALSIIGGLNDARADAQGILILRRYPEAAVAPGGPDHARTIFTLDLTTADGLFSAGQFRVYSGDLIYVTESPLTSTSIVLSLISRAFGLAGQVNGL